MLLIVSGTFSLEKCGKIWKNRQFFPEAKARSEKYRALAQFGSITEVKKKI